MLELVYCMRETWGRNVCERKEESRDQCSFLLITREVLGRCKETAHDKQIPGKRVRQWEQHSFRVNFFPALELCNQDKRSKGWEALEKKKKYERIWGVWQERASFVTKVIIMIHEASSFHRFSVFSENQASFFEKRDSKECMKKSFGMKHEV